MGRDTCWEAEIILAISSYHDILELLHADYKAQLFWEALTSRPPSSLHKLRLT